MTEKLLIGVGHKARQGKDSIASAIHHEYPALTRVMGFADALKAYCRVEHGMTVKDAPLLQDVGVSMRDWAGIDVWINALYYAALECPEPVVIVPDVRFPNEAEFIKEHGGTLVKVERQSISGGRFIAADRDPKHESETALDDWLEWDYVVENWEGCKHQLRDSAITMFDEVYDRWQKQQAMVAILREVADDAA